MSVNLETYVLPAIIVFLTLYILYTHRLSTALTAIGIAAISFAVTKSKLVMLGILLAALLIKPLNNIIAAKVEPMGAEGFQAKDPVTVQERIEHVRTTVPLAPKVEVVTGVLESASILDNTPLQGIDELAKEGVPGSSIPASAKARVLIYPPSEDSFPISKESINMLPKDNPYLQTGQDRLAEEVARAQKGTDLYAPDSGSLDGVAAGAGPAF